jgi:hypothetical protein
MSFPSRSTVQKLMLIGLMLSSSIVFSDALSQREQAAQQVAQQFMKQLAGHLKKEMKSNGPVEAIKVCKEIAPELASKLSLENGWRVTRVTTRPRNSLLGSADLWERETLIEFEARASQGEPYATMSKAEVVDEAGKSYFRFMKPLAVKPVCLTCHGSDEQIPPAVKTALDKMYPQDQARNYSLGDLRGSISIKQPLDIPLRQKF